MTTPQQQVDALVIFGATGDLAKLETFPALVGLVDRGVLNVPVIGVAKTAFGTATHAARVLRGQSSRPLYVTAAGMTIADAAVLVTEMAGRFRVPDALKSVDHLARTGAHRSPPVT